VVLAVLVLAARARHAGFAALLIGVLVAVLLMLTRLDRVWWWLWLVPVLLAALAVWSWRQRVERRWVARVFFGVLLLGTLLAGVSVNRFVAGEGGAVRVGPVPRGVPISLVMNMNPEAPPLNLVRAVSGLTRGILLSARSHDA